jgi:putative glutamine amidotransferase
MTKPLIGLTTSRMQNIARLPIFSTNIPYAKSVAEAGGIPILIPLCLSDDDLDLLISRVDGILFTGGYDVDPRRYGNQPHPKVEGVDADRDRMEIHLVQALIHQGKPFFGICRGFQVINIALGGSLYEDLFEQFSSEIIHDNHDHSRNYLAHNIDVRSGSRLSEFLGIGNVGVNSLHHQGVSRLARGLQLSAMAPDRLVEAFELADYPFGLAVQWHPEELQEHASMRNLFKAFVQASQSDGSQRKVGERKWLKNINSGR